jgi:cytidyltransferase-like protein
VERLTGVSEQGPIAGPQDGPDGSLRVGVVGGTFDPIHLGHLILAEEARDQLGLSIIYFVTLLTRRISREGASRRPATV